MLSGEEEDDDGEEVMESFFIVPSTELPPPGVSSTEGVVPKMSLCLRLKVSFSPRMIP